MSSNEPEKSKPKEIPEKPSSAGPSEEEQMLEQPIVSVRIHFDKEKLLEIDVDFCSFLGLSCSLEISLLNANNPRDLKEYLESFHQLYFFSSYHFAHNGRPLSEISDLSQTNVSGPSLGLEIVPETYGDYSSRVHLNKVFQTSLNPRIFNRQSALLKTIETNPLGICDMVSAGKPWSLNYTSVDQITQADTQEEITAFYEKEAEAHKEPELSPLLASAGFSVFNPPPSYRQAAGDFYYFYIETIEGKIYNFTACSQGFFLNKSKAKTFDPTRQSKTYYSLIDILKEISPEFSTRFAVLINEKEKIRVSELPLAEEEQRRLWLATKGDLKEENSKKKPNDINSQCAVYPGKATIQLEKGYSNWNENFQICSSLHATNLVEMVTKGKGFQRLNREFIQKALEGGCAVIDGKIPPLTAAENKQQNIYVYDNIFFSFTVDNVENFSQDYGSEISASSSLANSDLRNISEIMSLNLESVSTLGTVIVDYKGFRVIGQTLIPGILSSEQAKMIKYGIVDDGNKIMSDPDFHDMFCKLAKYFKIEDSVSVTDGEENLHTIVGSPEVKGVLGGDGRKYILETARLSPRDLNFVGEGCEYDSCLLRRSILDEFAIHTFKEHIREEAKNKEETKGEENDEGEKGEKNTKIEVEHEKFKKDLEMRFNTMSHVRPVPGTKLETPADQVQKSEENLKSVAGFIMKLLPLLAHDIVYLTSFAPTDYPFLKDTFHRRGINFRYLGHLLNTPLLQSQEHRDSFLYLERVLVGRSAKHMLLELMRFYQPSISGIISHVLNCLVVGAQNWDALESYSLRKYGSMENSFTAEIKKGEKSGTEEKKKKKKKKKKKGQAKDKVAEEKTFYLDQPEPALEGIPYPKPSEIWERVVVIAKGRYNYEIKARRPFDMLCLSESSGKLALLRLVCQLTGIVIETPSLSQAEAHTEETPTWEQLLKRLPFSPESIKDAVPRFKGIEDSQELPKMRLEAAIERINQNDLETAKTILIESLKETIEICGLASPDFVNCLSKLAGVFCCQGDLKKGIKYQILATGISETVFGLDHLITAQSHLELAFFFYNDNQQMAAFNHIFKALKLFDMIGSKFNPNSLQALRYLIRLLQQSGQMKSMIHFSDEFLARHEKMLDGESLKLAEALNFSASMLMEAGELGQAQKLLERRVEILEKNKNKPNVEQALQQTKILVGLAMQSKKEIKAPNEESFSEKDFLLEKLRASRITRKIRK